MEEQKPRRNPIEKLIQNSESIESILLSAANAAFSELQDERKGVSELSNKIFDDIGISFEYEIAGSFRLLHEAHRTNDFPIIAAILGKNTVGGTLKELRSRGESSLTDDEIESIVRTFTLKLQEKIRKLG